MLKNHFYLLNKITWIKIKKSYLRIEIFYLYSKRILFSHLLNKIHPGLVTKKPIKHRFNLNLCSKRNLFFYLLNSTRFFVCNHYIIISVHVKTFFVKTFHYHNKKSVMSNTTSRILLYCNT